MTTETFDIGEIFPESEPTPIDEAKRILENTEKEVVVTTVIESLAKAVVGHSIRFAVSGALATVVPVDSRKDKIRLAVASYAISGLVADKAKERVSEKIDEKIDFAKKVFSRVQEMGQAKPDADSQDAPNL